MNEMMVGAIAMACFVVGLFFLRFWKKTRDRFFLFFSVSFFVEGVNRIVFGLSNQQDEHEPLIYLVRFLSFGLILFAIVDKNRRKT